jgi:predicted DNA-binding transcriptional regulator
MSCECPLGKWLAELTEELENKLEEYEKEIKNNND